MKLKDEKRNLSQEEQKVFDDYLEPNDFDFKNDEKSKSKKNENAIKNVYESINKSEVNNINNAQVMINDKNKNEKKKIINYDNKFETNINEQKKNDLLNSKMDKLKSNNKNKIMFSTQLLDGKNQPYDCNMEEKKSSKKKEEDLKSQMTIDFIAKMTKIILN